MFKPSSPVVVVENDVDRIKWFVSQGYCPVECSVGGESIVDELMMDHHGPLSHLESVALRAYRDLFAARAHDPRFVIAGCADADASFAVASLIGALPHPSRDVPGLPPQERAIWAADLTPLASTIARVDTDPIGVRVVDLPAGDVLVAWNAVSGTGRDDLSAVTGVGLWVSLTTSNAAAPLMERAVQVEQDRVAAAEVDMGRAMGGFDMLVIDGPTVWGFDVWYERRDSRPDSDVDGWVNPIVMSRTSSGNVTIGCPNIDVAEHLFGPGGLLNLFPKLEPAGWGGRESVGGSPRGAVISDAELAAVADWVNALRQDR